MSNNKRVSLDIIFTVPRHNTGTSYNDTILGKKSPIKPISIANIRNDKFNINEFTFFLLLVASSLTFINSDTFIFLAFRHQVNL